MSAQWDEYTVQAIKDGLDRDVNCVIAGFDVNLSYKKVFKACNYLQRPGSIFLVSLSILFKYETERRVINS